MKNGITYSELNPSVVYYVRGFCSVTHKTQTFSEPIFDKANAEKKLAGLEKKMKYHKLWVSMTFV